MPDRYGDDPSQQDSSHYAPWQLRQMAIKNCGLCDDQGYTRSRTVCDHIDHRPAAERGRRLIFEVMGWTDRQPPDSPESPAPIQTHAPNPSSPQETQ